MRILQMTLCLAAALPIALQPTSAQPSGTPTPTVVTIGRGEVELKPDRARIEFGVETRAQTAAAAATENSRRLRAVLDTVQRLGITAEHIQTASLQVTPEMVYPGQGQPPKVSGYVTRNSVRLEVLKLDQVGSLIDAALARGATNVAGLQFYSSRATDARREALAKAVLAARLDAEAMAKAAECQLGTLIEISGPPPSDGPVWASMDLVRPRIAALTEPTPVILGELKISEVVTVRWAIRQ